MLNNLHREFLSIEDASINNLDKHVYNNLLQNDILTRNQSGFTKGDSAVNQLSVVSISNEFGKALDSGKEIRVVFCDISKAFDRVSFCNKLLYTCLYTHRSIHLEMTLSKEIGL
jgi:hypothetical protein